LAKLRDATSRCRRERWSERRSGGDARLALTLQCSDHPAALLTMTDRITLIDKYAAISDHWNPRVAAELNRQQVKLVKILGAFDWHSHEHEDELFFVHRGEFRMEFRDRSVTLHAGEMIVVPRGIEHRPVADQECELMLFEPAGTLNTGNVVSERTRVELDRI
jgi:mannose-6-phosphate isomerase-like protein (cupin superfamily)